MRDENLNEFDEASNNNDDVSLPDTDIVGILLGHPKVQTLMTTHGRVARSDMKTNLVATINGIIEGCNLLAAAARRDVASDTRLYQEAEVAGRRKRDAEIRDLSETYGEEVQKAFDELYESSIGLIREELQLKHDEPCINGFDGELALITAHRDALNDELAERGLTVEKLAKNAKDFAVAPSQKKPANVEDGHSSTELLKGANELLDKAWNRHRDAEQALTVL